jgi:hypothetical protein
LETARKAVWKWQIDLPPKFDIIAQSMGFLRCFESAGLSKELGYQSEYLDPYLLNNLSFPPNGPLFSTFWETVLRAAQSLTQRR